MLQVQMLFGDNASNHKFSKERHLFYMPFLTPQIEKSSFSKFPHPAYGLNYGIFYLLINILAKF